MQLTGDFNNDLYVWCLMGVGRQTALAKQIGCTRAYINSIVCIGVNVSADQKERIQRAVKRIEQRESKLELSVRNNILKCAKLVSSGDKTIRKEAKEKLLHWSELFSSFD
jgi:DNA-binding transcriptional regulator YdaS (Cro superfamily)